MDKKDIKKVVLAYSGGLDTSIIIPWLKENYNNCEVIAVSGNVGQASELEGLEEKAIKTGASKLYIEDLTKEFIEAAAVLGMPVTCGVECRVDMSMTKLNGLRINNPDQKSVAYVTMHGIPHQNIDAVDAFLAPYRAKRNERNRKMIDNVNKLLPDIGLDFEWTVYGDVSNKIIESKTGISPENVNVSLMGRASA